MNRIRVGIVGLGEVAQITHLPIITTALNQYYEVTAICDISPTLTKAIGEQFQVQEQYLDYHELVASPNVDVVFVLNSDEYHADTAIAALNQGKHAFIEKPVCLTLSDAQKIIEARDAAKKQVMVAYMRRYAPAFLQAKELINELPNINFVRVKDIIGQNRLIIDQSSNVRRPQDIPVEATADRNMRASSMENEAVGEGYDASIYRTYRLLCGLGSHDLSAMRELLGAPRRVVSAHTWSGGSFLLATFEYDNFFVSFEMGVDLQRRFDAHIEVFSEHKSFKIQYDTPYIRHLPTTLDIAETIGDSYRESRIRPTFKDAYTIELEELYYVLTDNRTVKTTVEDSVQDLKLFQRIVSLLK